MKTSNKDEYKVSLRVNVDKVWIDDKGNDVPASNMNDYIDIGVMGADTHDKTGRTQTNVLYKKRYRLKRGDHEFTIVVKGQPKSVAIDPLGYLIDRNPNDNVKNIE
jgi:hypothetical protein